MVHECGHCGSRGLTLKEEQVNMGKDVEATLLCVWCPKCRVAFLGRAFGTLSFDREGIVERWRIKYSYNRTKGDSQPLPGIYYADASIASTKIQARELRGDFD